MGIFIENILILIVVIVGGLTAVAFGVFVLGTLVRFVLSKRNRPAPRARATRR